MKTNRTTNKKIQAQKDEGKYRGTAAAPAPAAAAG
jgi:hypothetical protein